VSLQLRKRALDQLQVYLAAGHVGVAGPELLAHASDGDAHFSLHPRFALLQHGRVVAPGKEVGVAGDIGHQGEHFLGAEPDEDGLVDRFHARLPAGTHVESPAGRTL
jgi:hypothetical protein